jgi:hypothetical protein
MLIAKRQGTPIKSSSRAATPVAAKSTGSPYRTPISAAFPKVLQSGKEERVGGERHVVQPSTGQERVDVAALIAEGEALAAAAAARGSNASINVARHDIAGARAGRDAENRVPSATTAPSSSIEMTQLDGQSAEHAQPTDLTDPYYDDLSAWLELTNYHDVAARKALLQPFLEQRVLEEEAARIAERIARLNKVQQDNAQTFRFGTPSSSRSSVAPPPLPASLPRSNGLKRERSPGSSSTGRASRRDVGSLY